MKTINNISINELIIKNSRFITLLYPLNDESLVSSIIDEVKVNYPKATHYCYSYITSNSKRSSDDGEPGGTAGMPMLNILEKEDVINVLAVTVRYFGGIKLGAGGLVRAYSKSVRDAIVNTNMVDVEDGYLVLITINYDEQKNLDYLLKKYVIVEKSYLLDVKYKVLIPKRSLDILSNYSYEILEEKTIEKVLD